ncbi:hypothetical protein BGX27_004968, partial [Mortierella sp. AM989]
MIARTPLLLLIVLAISLSMVAAAPLPQLDTDVNVDDDVLIIRNSNVLGETLRRIHENGGRTLR